VIDPETATVSAVLATVVCVFVYCVLLQLISAHRMLQQNGDGNSITLIMFVNDDAQTLVVSVI